MPSVVQEMTKALIELQQARNAQSIAGIKAKGALATAKQAIPRAQAEEKLQLQTLQQKAAAAKAKGQEQQGQGGMAPEDGFQPQQISSGGGVITGADIAANIKDLVSGGKGVQAGGGGQRAPGSGNIQSRAAASGIQGQVGQTGQTGGATDPQGIAVAGAPGTVTGTSQGPVTSRSRVTGGGLAGALLGALLPPIQTGGGVTTTTERDTRSIDAEAKGIATILGQIDRQEIGPGSLANQLLITKNRLGQFSREAIAKGVADFRTAKAKRTSEKAKADLASERISQRRQAGKAEEAAKATNKLREEASQVILDRASGKEITPERQRLLQDFRQLSPLKRLEEALLGSAGANRTPRGRPATQADVDAAEASGARTPEEIRAVLDGQGLTFGE